MSLAPMGSLGVLIFVFGLAVARFLRMPEVPTLPGIPNLMVAKPWTPSR